MLLEEIRIANVDNEDRWTILYLWSSLKMVF